MPETAKFSLGVIIGCVAVAIGAIFMLDLMTPLGSAEWVMYVLPVALCLMSRKPGLPLIAAAACTILIYAGYVLSPGGGDPLRALVNRSLGTMTVWIIAAMTGAL